MTSSSRLRRWLSGALATALVATLLLSFEAAQTQPEPAAAANAATWDPGYIIDDAAFYDYNSMNAGEVQSFLNQKGGTCRSGYVCLSGYGTATETRAADRYCGAYTGAAYQTAAQIIDGVARACKISQRVLLVLLQKEQSLVTSTAPSASAYRAATGMGCPDTAGCNPDFTGFFYQVYFAARQYQIYRLNPTNYGYQAGRWNTIKLHPNAACGTASVYIQNQATAALYIYTPYTPNTAALNNLYGLGDACSTYGNRNFWRIFTDWFGDPRTYTVNDGFLAYWNAQGGATGQMGSPTSYLVVVDENGGGSYQRFQGGIAYASYQTGIFFVANNVFSSKYKEYGGPAASLGWPSSEQMCAANGVCFQKFTGGTITYAASAGTYVVGGGLAQFWETSGSVYGLGAAIAPSAYVVKQNGYGWTQRFQKGSISLSSVGTFAVPGGPIETAWAGSGAGGGGYGWPVAANTCTGTSCAQSFQGGTLTYTPTHGTFAIRYGFDNYWKASGGMQSLGVALTALRASQANGGGWVQQFASAAVTQRVGAGLIRIPYGALWNMWATTGGESGYGWPMADATCESGSCAQLYQNAVLTVSSQGNFAVIGGFKNAYGAFGGLPTVGVATASLRYNPVNGGGFSQPFTLGLITQAVGTPALFTPTSPILSTWQFYGAEYTWLGWPISPQTCTAGICTQQFQHGTATSNGPLVQFIP